MRGPNLGFQYFCISAARGLSCLTIYTRPPKWSLLPLYDDDSSILGEDDDKFDDNHNNALIGRLLKNVIGSYVLVILRLIDILLLCLLARGYRINAFQIWKDLQTKKPDHSFSAGYVRCVAKSFQVWAKYHIKPSCKIDSHNTKATFLGFTPLQVWSLKQGQEAKLRYAVMHL